MHASDLRTAFAKETEAANLRRLRVLVPLFVVLHAVHIWLFQTSDAQQQTLTQQLLRWRHDVVLVHALTLVAALGLVTLAYPLAKSAARVLGPVAALTYMLHGAIIAGVDQLSMANVTAFIGYALGIAVTVALEPMAVVLVYGVGLAAFVVSVWMMQSVPSARLMVMPNGFSAVAVGAALALMMRAARKRDLAQRLTIDAQRKELTEMNLVLERRVSEQVSEIVARAKEIETLNTQLQTQVRARSRELSMALARLARDRTGTGRLKNGAVLGGRFVIGELLGEGGMGSVYAGTDRSTNQEVAVKVIQAASAQELDSLHRFFREAGTTARVSHPAVVKMIHVDVSGDGMLYQVQERVHGVTLRERIKRQGLWDPKKVARLGAVLCDALATAHAEGVVHRDVKPGNMMLTTTAPGLKLLDFGISKITLSRDGDGSSGVGKAIGTPGYMAPEQLDGTRELTGRVDVFACGVVMFSMLTGRYPFDEATMNEIILRHVVEEAPNARTIVRALPEELTNIVARCLRQDPADRPDADDVARELSHFADAQNAPPLEEIARDVSSLPAVPASTEVATTVAGRRGTTPS